MFVLPTFAFGVVASPTVPPETFDTATLENGQTAIGNSNTLTITIQPSSAIAASGTITLAGLTGSQTSDNASLTVGGTNAAIFGSSGAWTQSSGTLVLTVAGGQSVPTGSDTVITFTLTNPASTNSGVIGVTLASSGFATANISGTFLNAVATFNVTTRDTEANILASTPTNPTDEVNIAFGTDTDDFYIYDGSAWYIYNDTPVFTNQYSVDFDGTEDYMDAGNISELNSISAFTISMWINFEDITGLSVRSVFTAGTSTSNRIEIIFNNINQVRFGVNGSIGSCVFDISSPTDYRSTDAWHNIVCTYDGTNVTLFFDGSQKSTTTSSVPSSTSSTHGNDATVGRRTLGGGSFYFNGYIDEVAIWNATLDSNDIADIYSGGPTDLTKASSYNTDRTSNLINYWRMGDDDGGTGTTITDKGSGENHGTLINTASPFGIVNNVPS